MNNGITKKAMMVKVTSMITSLEEVIYDVCNLDDMFGKGHSDSKDSYMIFYDEEDQNIFKVKRLKKELDEVLVAFGETPIFEKLSDRLFEDGELSVETLIKHYLVIRISVMEQLLKVGHEGLTQSIIDRFEVFHFNELKNHEEELA